jgi:CRP/FNR family transcriptional regulator, anaerobic regulatory protein
MQHEASGAGIDATSALVSDLLACYPSLSGLPTAPMAEEVSQRGRLIEAGPGQRLFDEGQPCAGFPLVLAGEICVARSSADSARTMELYRVGRGEICVVSTSCLLSQRPFNAHGTATGNVRLLLLSPPLFERWTAHRPFREFVFQVFSDRLTDLMTLIDAIAFQRLDQRLAHHLLGHGRQLHTTHQALADELGTVREIITRILKRFEAAGCVGLGRERIEVLDAARLRALASGTTL